MSAAEQFVSTSDVSDGRAAVARDRMLSAQFEHLIGIAETGC